MYAMEKSTAEMRVVTPEAKTWKSRVNATIRHVRSRFGSSRLEGPLTWPADNDSLGRRPLRHWEGSAGVH